MRHYGLELKWHGHFVVKSKDCNLERFKEILLKELSDSNAISKLFRGESKSIGKITLEMRFFDIEISLIVRRNNFTIISRASISDIPTPEEEQQLTYPITDIPNDPEPLLIVASPNTAANYFLYHVLKKSLRKIDSEARIVVSMPSLIFARGIDPLDEQ